MRSRNLSASALQQVAGDILARYGSKLTSLLLPPISDDAVETEFAKLAGSQALAEMRGFANDPDVQRFRALTVPLRHNSLVDQIADALDRYLTAARLTIGLSLNPIASGNNDLLELTEKRSLGVDEAFKPIANEA